MKGNSYEMRVIKFDPITNIHHRRLSPPPVTDFDVSSTFKTFFLLFTLDDDEHAWIMKTCRKGWDENVGGKLRDFAAK